jgi:hypothetical protein
VNFKADRKLLSKKKFESYDYAEVRVAAEILLHLHKINNLWTDQDIVDGLIERLELILKDKEWFESWREESGAKKVKRDIKRFIRGLKQVDAYG